MKIERRKYTVVVEVDVSIYDKWLLDEKKLKSEIKRIVSCGLVLGNARIKPTRAKCLKRIK